MSFLEVTVPPEHVACNKMTKRKILHNDLSNFQLFFSSNYNLKKRKAINNLNCPRSSEIKKGAQYILNNKLQGVYYIFG